MQGHGEGGGSRGEREKGYRACGSWERSREWRGQGKFGEDRRAMVRGRGAAVKWRRCWGCGRGARQRQRRSKGGSGGDSARLAAAVAAIVAE